MLLCLLPLLLCFGCKKKLDYFDYVSELRSNIFLAKTEDFSLRIHAVTKEAPYAVDGVKMECSPRFEAYLVAPEGNRTVDLRFTVDGRELGGEMSYDNVKAEYFYSATLDVAARSSVDCTITYGEETLTLTATSVLTDETMAPRAALAAVENAHPEIFTALTDEYGFAGEIYLRLIFEDSPYYYVGVIDREGKVDAFLLNAETGVLLAHRKG